MTSNYSRPGVSERTQEWVGAHESPKGNMAHVMSVVPMFGSGNWGMICDIFM